MGEGGREMEEDKAKLKHGNTMPKNSFLSQRFGADSRERMEFFVQVICTHLPT
jgi:hypothetical protein